MASKTRCLNYRCGKRFDAEAVPDTCPGCGQAMDLATRGARHLAAIAAATSELALKQILAAHADVALLQFALNREERGWAQVRIATRIGELQPSPAAPPVLQARRLAHIAAAPDAVALRRIVDAIADVATLQLALEAEERDWAQVRLRARLDELTPPAKAAS